MVKPNTDGRIRMPSVDGAMIKVSPRFTRAADDKGTPLGATVDGQRNEKILARMRKRLERAIGAESDNRKAALDDRQFKAGKQWPSEVIAQRNLDKRPWLTINKVPTFVHQIVNAQRENRPTIGISPVGDAAISRWRSSTRG